MHKEGFVTLLAATILFGGVLFATFKWLPVLFPFLALVLAVIYFLLFWFFRNPKRKVEQKDNGKIYAPADGKVVVIEKTDEPEYFKDQRLQVSIFMSPLNVHVNRNPVSGNVLLAQYHPGKYLAAWNPKSSTENERTTTVIENEKGIVLFRQIAGALARRIVQYVKTGDHVLQGEEMGFIKFGSRVDIFLPLDAKINVTLNQKVEGAKTVIAELVN